MRIFSSLIEALGYTSSQAVSAALLPTVLLTAQVEWGVGTLDWANSLMPSSVDKLVLTIQ